MYITFKPCDINDVNIDEQKNYILQHKIATLNLIEAQLFAAKKEDKNSAINVEPGWIGYKSTIIANILENLQLEIHDLHICYEDKLPNQTTNLKGGIMLKTLKAESCDENWVLGLNVNQQSSFKVIELDQFSIYLDSFVDTPESNQYPEVIGKNQDIDHAYIINPISLNIKMKKDLSSFSLNKNTNPRIICDLSSNDIEVNINEVQFQQAIICYKKITFLKTLVKSRLYRPLVPIKTNRRAWWLYACQSFGFLRNHDRKKENIGTENLKYIKLYKQMLSDQNFTLSEEQKTFKDYIELERSLEELKILREISLKYLNYNKSEKEFLKTRISLFRWLPQIYNRNKTSGTKSNETSTVNEKNQVDIEDEILKVFDIAVKENSIFKKDAVFAKFHMIINKITFKLFNKNKPVDIVEPIFQIQLKSLTVEIEVRPKSKSFLLCLLLDSLTANVNLNTKKFKLIRTQKSENIDCIFRLEYEKLPNSKETELKMKLNLLETYYDVEAMHKLFNILHQFYYFDDQDEPRDNHVETYQNILASHKNLQVQQTEKPKIKFKFDIASPNISVAFKTSNSDKLLIVMINFHKLSLSNFSSQTMKKDVLYSKTDIQEDLFVTPGSTPKNDSFLALPKNNSENMMEANKESLEIFSFSLKYVKISTCTVGINGNVRADPSFTMEIVKNFTIDLDVLYKNSNGNNQTNELFINGSIINPSFYINEATIFELLLVFNELSTNSNLMFKTFKQTNKSEPEPNKYKIFSSIFCDAIHLNILSLNENVAQLKITGLEAQIDNTSGEIAFTFLFKELLVFNKLTSSDTNLKPVLAIQGRKYSEDFRHIKHDDTVLMHEVSDGKFHRSQ